MQSRSFIAMLLLLVLVGACKKNDTASVNVGTVENSIRHAKGLSIYNYDGYSIVRVSNPWPKAEKDYTYILQKENAVVPDSLQKYASISVPIKKIVVTSTTHIPSLEMLGVENSLVGFPSLNFISSEKVRANIDAGKVRELGSDQNLDTEIVIDIQPDVIVGYGIDNNNTSLDNLEKSGLKVLFNGDWNEQTPLGKAEWIKLFGALYGLEEKARTLFAKIEKDYLQTLELAKKTPNRPTVMAGAMFEDKWYLPQGNSWSALMIKDAGGKYLWAGTDGTGSLSLPFESVLEKAGAADFWIGEFTSLAEMQRSNIHYSQFAPFKNKKVYSFSSKKGKTDGVLYYELAPNRPDLVLKDIVKILHPELLPDYELYFFQKLE